MKLFQFDHPHRKKHFDFFRNMDQPHFGITAEVDISHFKEYLKKEKLHLTASLVYVLARAANEVKPFRWRMRGDQVVEHSSVQPSFTVSTEKSDVFSFCTVDYDPDGKTFIDRALTVIKKMQTEPSLEDEEGRDDFLFMSAFPWVSFTSMHHAMHYSPVDSVPRISWGKFFTRDGKLLMPLAVQAHHALVDGRDMGTYYEKTQELLNSDFLDALADV